MENIFEIKDKTGRKIKLTKKQWTHIKKDHPEIVDGISEHVLASDSGVTTRDMWDVRRSDAVLFNLLQSKKVSIGTMIEYGWASSFNKPIITVMEKQGNVHEHLMIRRLSGYRVETLEEGLEVIRALFDY